MIPFQCNVHKVFLHRTQTDILFYVVSRPDRVAYTDRDPLFVTNYTVIFIIFEPLPETSLVDRPYLSTYQSSRNLPPSIRRAGLRPRDIVPLLPGEYPPSIHI